ncbi:hypothetical protein K438DRAFT_1998250 [Mycena galopus ATCC 62051]|nr:hypothetical protein K438DRAFT_1998250 [Mycena galopus ATCC 62051]
MSPANEIEEEWGGISSPTSTPSVLTKKPIPSLGDSDDDGALPEVDGLTTWASRNPGKPVQHPRQRPKCVMGPEQRCTLRDKLKLKKSRTAALNADLAELSKERAAKVAELAAKHKFKVPLVQQRLYGSSNFKKPRKCYIPYHPVPPPAESGLLAYYAARLITILRHYAGLPPAHILRSAGLRTSVRPLAEDGFLHNEVF